MFKKKLNPVYKELEEKILDEKDYQSKYSEYGSKLSYEEAKDLLKYASSFIQEKNLLYNANFKFLGFTDGNKKDINVQNVRIQQDENDVKYLFKTELKTKEQIKEAIKCYDINFFPKFFRPIHEELNQNIFNDIDLNSLPDLNSIMWEETYKTINQNFIPCDLGFYIDDCFGVGYTYQIIFCNQKIFYQNMKTLCQVMYEYYKKALYSNINVQEIFAELSDDVFKFYPEMKENNNIVSDFIAFGCKKHVIEFVKNPLDINIILKAIELNPLCYLSLTQKWQKNKDICSKVLECNFKMLNYVVEYAGISQEVWFEKIMNILKE